MGLEEVVVVVVVEEVVVVVALLILDWEPNGGGVVGVTVWLVVIWVGSSCVGIGANGLASGSMGG